MSEVAPEDLGYLHEHSTHAPRTPGPDEPANQAPSVEQTVEQPSEPEPAAIASLAPSSITAGAGPVPVTVTGTGFTARAQVYADEEAQSTLFVSETELAYNAQADQAGTQTVTVHDGGLVSNAIELTVS